MLKRTLSLARKRSQSTLSMVDADTQDVYINSEPDDYLADDGQEQLSDPTVQAPKKTMTEPVKPRETENRPSSKGHSRLRSGFSLSLGRRKN